MKYIDPTIVPLDAKGDLYALLDDRGQFAGTGTREVCEVMLSIMRSGIVEKPIRKSSGAAKNTRARVRAAIQI